VKEIALGSEIVFRPALLLMNKGTPPGAEGAVLERGEHNEFLFGIGHKLMC